MTRGQDIEHAHPALVYGAIAFALGSVFVSMALLRLIDADEGIYLFNTRLVLEGKLPYHDFHYPQMPLLLYVYGAWLKVVGLSWYAGRLLSALFATALGVALAHHVGRATGRRAWGVLAAGIFASSAFAFGWLPLVKTYALATLALFVAYALVADRVVRWRLVASGLLLGLAIDTRLYVAALLPVFAVAVFRARSSWRDLFHLSTGAVIALSLNTYLFVLAPDSFVFNVVGYHALRSSHGLIGDLAQKLGAIRSLLSLELPPDATHVHFTLVLALWLGFVVSSRWARARLPLSVPIAAVLMLVSLLPTPTHTQYFCMAMPFLIADAVRFVARVANAAPVAPGRHVRLRHLAAVFVIVYGLGAAVAAYRFTIDGSGVIFSETDPQNWTIATVNRVARAIDATLPPKATTAMSWWPGYFVESRATVFPGLENPFALSYSGRLPTEDVTRRHFVTHGELNWHIEHHRVPVVVLGNWMFDTKPFYRSRLAAHGYVMVDKIEDTEVYRFASNGTATR